MVSDPYLENNNSELSPLEQKLAKLKPGDEVECLVDGHTYKGRFVKVQGDQWQGDTPEIVIEMAFPESTIVV